MDHLAEKWTGSRLFPRAPRRCHRPAFTLVEVLLTLCVLVMIAGLSWPPMARMFRSHRLTAAANQVRSCWRAARSDAIDSGETCAFECVFDGGEYRVRQLAEDPNTGEAVSAVAGLSGASESSNDATTSTHSLPDGVTFSSAATGAAGDFDSTAGWSDPICFYGDGTATSVRLVLSDEDGRSIEIALRRLTGLVTVGEMFPHQDSSP